jgi:hypothetical protein
VRNIKRITAGAAGFAAGFLGAYFFLGTIWTHLFVRPENVTALDFYLVIALSASAGIVVALGAAKLATGTSTQASQASAGRVAHA